MTNAQTPSEIRGKRLFALAGLALSLQAPIASAQSLIEGHPIKAVISREGTKHPATIKLTRANYDTYILGPGDGLQIELLDLPELSGIFFVGPDGSIYLPRLRALHVEGLTLEELSQLLTQQFRKYVLDPQVYVRPVIYRPIRIYVGGEVKRPGYYTLSGGKDLSSVAVSTEQGQLQPRTSSNVKRLEGFSSFFPTVYDAIREAQGITPYSNLSKVHVTRKRPKKLGGGRKRAELNFLALITEGNESHNIRLFDGDVVHVSKSSEVMRDQLLKAGQTNLSPQFINVFVTGRVKTPGGVSLPQGSSLNQAIALAGGPRLIRGKVEFVRFTQYGEIDRRIFRYDPAANADNSNNPILSSGDIIRIRDTPLSNSISVLNEITGPAIGIYSVYSLFDSLNR